jgi:hypothetical protein
MKESLAVFLLKKAITANSRPSNIGKYCQLQFCQFERKYSQWKQVMSIAVLPIWK